MTDATERERRLAGLVQALAELETKRHDLVRQRNQLMREMNREDGVHPKRLRELSGLQSLPLAYRIAAGEDR
jgi:hypothetical protein